MNKKDIEEIGDRWIEEKIEVKIVDAGMAKSLNGKIGFICGVNKDMDEVYVRINGKDSIFRHLYHEVELIKE